MSAVLYDIKMRFGIFDYYPLHYPRSRAGGSPVFMLDLLSGLRLPRLGNDGRRLIESRVDNYALAGEAAKYVSGSGPMSLPATMR